MSLRARIFIIVGIVVLIITAVAILLIRNIQQRQAGPSQPSSTTTDSNLTVIDSSNFSTSSLSTTVPPNVNTATRVVTDPVEVTKLSVRQFARVFVERYATYSSDNSFQNIHDVETIVTKSLLNYLSKSSTTITSSQPFIGVTTKVITTEISEWSDTTATVKVQTMRTEQRGTTVSNTQQSGTVKLIKEGDQWLVDGIYWDR